MNGKTKLEGKLPACSSEIHSRAARRCGNPDLLVRNVRSKKVLSVTAPVVKLEQLLSPLRSAIEIAVEGLAPSVHRRGRLPSAKADGQPTARWQRFLTAG